jgi:CRISPR-associated endoribonuclease Cas6
MRVKLKFNIVNSEGIKTIPVNYRYELHCLLSNLLNDFNNKKIKDYSFSDLYFVRHKISDIPVKLTKDGEKLVLFNTKKIELWFSSIDKVIINNLINKLENKKYLSIFNIILEYTGYEEHQVDSEKFKNKILFTTGTPVLLYNEKDGKKIQYSPTTDKTKTEINLDYLNLLKNNIKNLLKIEKDFELNIILKTIKYKPQTFNFKSNNTQRFHSYMYDFEIIANEEIMEKIYYSGMGNNKGLGFGFLKLKTYR